MRSLVANPPASEPRVERVRRFYRWFSRVYDPFRTAWSRWTREAERDLDRVFAERIGPGSRVLELGPGTGINLLRLQRLAPGFRSYLGLDASEAMLERARSRAGGDPRIALRLGDVTDLSGVAGPFDFVVSTWLLSHLERPHEVVAASLERLVPGGTAVFLFTTLPRSRVVRGLVTAALRVARARFVDADAIRAIPGLETLTASAGGMATLAVFRRPAS